MPKVWWSWRGYDGAHWQIYRWDPKAQTAVNISLNNYDNDDPRINAQGVVVWLVGNDIASQQI